MIATSNYIFNHILNNAFISEKLTALKIGSVATYNQSCQLVLKLLAFMRTNRSKQVALCNHFVLSVGMCHYNGYIIAGLSLSLNKGEEPCLLVIAVMMLLAKQYSWFIIHYIILDRSITFL